MQQIKTQDLLPSRSTMTETCISELKKLQMVLHYGKIYAYEQRDGKVRIRTQLSSYENAVIRYWHLGKGIDIIVDRRTHEVVFCSVNNAAVFEKSQYFFGNTCKSFLISNSERPRTYREFQATSSSYQIWEAREDDARLPKKWKDYIRNGHKDIYPMPSGYMDPQSIDPELCKEIMANILM